MAFILCCAMCGKKDKNNNKNKMETKKKRKIKKMSANEFIHAEMTMEQAKRRVLNAPTVSF